MFRRRKHGHIHTDFGDNGNSRKELDTRNGGNELYLGAELIRKRANEGFEIGLALVNGGKVRTNNAEFE